MSEKISCDELFVGKHFRLKNEHGSITMDAGSSCVGVWVGRNAASEQVCLVSEKGKPPYIALYGKRSRFPVALTAEGIQVPVGESAKIIRWEKLLELVGE